MYARTQLTALVFAAATALTACGGGGGSSTTSAAATTPPATTAAATTSAASSAPATDTASGAGLPGNLEGCMDAANVGLAMAGVGLEGLTGKFDQAAFDKAFPAGTIDKLPNDLKDLYTAAETAAKDIVGKSGTEAMNATTAYTDKLTAYSEALGKVCS
ncbi:MAG TPA: hypothetical protein PKH97_06100 [Tetrasphaera sp.]|uniref:hypothetical protein n=1 Tax=Nostocoides sp. TaxID=1917966 RepID=UPI002BFE1C92|nr:hypothetical protein [Tetrasphaera sp.]HNQ06743.1 hypothetical protein [Tetrasphaera sp.]